MARLSEEKINEIRRLYSELGIYSQVAKQVGCSPATVKKYVSEDVPVIRKEAINKFSDKIIPIEEMDLTPFQGSFLELARVSTQELEEIKQLWEELV